MTRFHSFRLCCPTLILLFGFSLLSSCSADERAGTVAPAEKIDYFENKAVKRRYFVVNGRKEGKMTEYHPNGQVRSERNFKNDQEDGRTAYYFPNGGIREVQYFVAGEKQRGDTIWYDTGEPQFTVDYKDSKKNGYFRKWSREGAIVIEAVYDQDTLVKVAKGIYHRDEGAVIDTVRKVYPATPESASGG